RAFERFTGPARLARAKYGQRPAVLFHDHVSGEVRNLPVGEEFLPPIYLLRFGRNNLEDYRGTLAKIPSVVGRIASDQNIGVIVGVANARRDFSLHVHHKRLASFSAQTLVQSGEDVPGDAVV